jgi:hypothetical protein
MASKGYKGFSASRTADRRHSKRFSNKAITEFNETTISTEDKVYAVFGVVFAVYIAVVLFL